MNPNRYLAWVGVALLLGTFSYSAWKIAARSEAHTDMKVVRFAHWQLESGVREALDIISREFEQQNPGVVIEQIVVPERIFPQWATTQLVGGTAPDLVSINGNVIGPERLARYFIPLGEEIDRPNPHNAGTHLQDLPWRNTFFDGMEGTYHEQLNDHYAVSPFAGTVRVFYNLRLWKQIMGHERPPADFAEFESAMEKMRDYVARTGRPLVGLAGSRYNAPLTMDYAVTSQTQKLATGLSSLVDLPVPPRAMGLALLQGRWRPTDPAMVSAFELARFYGRLMPPGFMQLDREDSMFYFLQERALLLQTGSWDSGSIRLQARFPIGIFALPTPGPEHPRFGAATEGRVGEGALRTAAGLGITRSSRHPELALSFLQYLTSVAGNQRFATLSGWLPVVVGAKPANDMSAFMPILEGYPGGPHLRSFPDGRRIFDNALPGLMSEDGSAEAFARALEPGLADAVRSDIEREHSNLVKNMQRNEVLAEGVYRLLLRADGEAARQRLQRRHQVLIETQAEMAGGLAFERQQLAELDR